MKGLFATVLAGIILVCVSSAQTVVPANPGKFKLRPIGDGVSPGVEVIPKDEPKPATARYTTHLVLSESRIWSSIDGKIITGKLIAFEDLVAETPQGAAKPVLPPPPTKPTVISDRKARFLVNQKAIEIPLARMGEADRELIGQIQAAIEKKAQKTPTP